MDKYVIKENSYTNPIDDLTFLDHLIFNFKLLFFLISIIPLIFISLCLGNYVKPIQNYLPMLGSNLPLRFVAKSEVASWTLFGFLAKMARTIFIKRNRHNTLGQKDIIKQSLLLKEKVLIFPEGTTSDGNRVLDFKSSLLSAVEKEDFFIQPITILYSEINGIPINRWLRPVIAWYGDMELQPHLSTLVSLRPIKVRLIFSDPVNSKLFSNRKELNNFLEKIIKTNYHSVL